MRMGFQAAVLSGVMLGLAVLGAAGSADATVVSGSFTGTVYTGTDTIGAFGGSSLAGNTITVNYSYNTAQLSYNSYSYYDDLIGGSAGGAITASVTINTQTFSAASVFGQADQIIAEQTGSNTEDTLDTAFSSSHVNAVDLTLISASSWVDGALLTSGFPSTLATFTPGQGGYLQDVYLFNAAGQEDTITFYNTGSTQPAPEPASLAIFGTSLIALRAARRRKRG
jgi:hypothetical protein